MTDSEALHLLEARLRAEVCSLAADLGEEILSGHVVTREEADTWIWETTDGHSASIYYGDGLLTIAGADPADVGDATMELEGCGLGCGQWVNAIASAVLRIQLTGMADTILGTFDEPEDEREELLRKEVEGLRRSEKAAQEVWTRG